MIENEGLVCVQIYIGENKSLMKMEISKEYYETCIDFKKIMDIELKRELKYEII